MYLFCRKQWSVTVLWCADFADINGLLLYCDVLILQTTIVCCCTVMCWFCGQLWSVAVLWCTDFADNNGLLLHCGVLILQTTMVCFCTVMYWFCRQHWSVAVLWCTDFADRYDLLLYCDVQILQTTMVCCCSVMYWFCRPQVWLLQPTAQPADRLRLEPGQQNLPVVWGETAGEVRQPRHHIPRGQLRVLILSLRQRDQKSFQNALFQDEKRSLPESCKQTPVFCLLVFSLRKSHFDNSFLYILQCRWGVFACVHLTRSTIQLSVGAVGDHKASLYPRLRLESQSDMSVATLHKMVVCWRQLWTADSLCAEQLLAAILTRFRAARENDPIESALLNKHVLFEKLGIIWRIVPVLLHKKHQNMQHYRESPLTFVLNGREFFYFF